MGANAVGFDESRLRTLADGAFADATDNALSETQALVATLNGEVVFERYGVDFDGGSTFISWSMAKSITSALCGVLVGQGRLSLEAPAAVAAWHEHPDEPRAAITLEQLLQMRSGLEWNEDYVDDTVSDVIEMLFGAGQHDVAGFATAKPLRAAPGTEWLYSSGTTNIISRILADEIGGGVAGLTAAIVDDLLVPAGMQNVTVKCDDAGTFVGSSFAYATARDYLAFGELYRNDGIAADGTRLLPEGWVDRSVEDHATCPDTGQGYGLQWWLARDGHGSFAANGYEGQRLQISRELGLTFVRLGKTSADHKDALHRFYADVTNCFV